MLYKVVRTDNFDRSGEKPGRDEKLIAENLTEMEADRKAQELNDQDPRVNSDWFFAVVPQDYKLKIYEP